MRVLFATIMSEPPRIQKPKIFSLICSLSPFPRMALVPPMMVKPEIVTSLELMYTPNVGGGMKFASSLFKLAVCKSSCVAVSAFANEHLVDVVFF